MLKITRDEYALCSFVQYRSADPRQRIAGWCCDNKDEVAEFIGITRPGLYKMCARLECFGLIESGQIGSLRVTAKWIDTEQECKQSLQNEPKQNVNKVYNERKQSLQAGVNKVNDSIIIKVKEEESKSKEEVVKETTTTGIDPLTLEAKKEKEIQPGGAAAGAGRVDIAAEIERLKQDAAVRENFTMTRRIPAEKFETYVQDFSREVSGTAETYWRLADFRRHFFNWAEKHYLIEKAKATEIKPTTQAPRIRAGQD